MAHPPPLVRPRSVPTGARAGAGTIVVGLLLDLNAHALAVGEATATSAGEHAAHLVVLIGMLLVLGGIVGDGIGATRRRGRQDRSASHAVR